MIMINAITCELDESLYSLLPAYLIVCLYTQGWKVVAWLSTKLCQWLLSEDSYSMGCGNYLAT